MHRTRHTENGSHQRKWPSRLHLIVALVFIASMFAPTASSANTRIGTPATLDELVASAAYDQPHSDVLRLYRAFFEREPDAAGAAYWIQQFDNGASLDDLAWGFSNSTEFTNRYGPALDNREFLAIVYGNVLGRTPDTGGLDYWTGELDKGLSQHGVVRWIAANDEFINSHAYPPAFIQLSDDMFLNADDFPTDWTVGFGNAGDPGDRSHCDNRIAMPNGSIVIQFTAPEQALLVQQITMSLGSIADAEAYLSLVRTYPATCSPFGDSNGIDQVITPLSLPVHGDSSAGITTGLTVASNGSTGVQHLVAWRMGRLVSLISIGGPAGTPASEISRLVDLAEPRMAAGLS